LSCSSIEMKLGPYNRVVFQKSQMQVNVTTVWPVWRARGGARFEAYRFLYEKRERGDWGDEQGDADCLRWERIRPEVLAA